MSLKYLLDTNIFSELMRPAPNPKIIKIVDRCKEETATASTVLHELLYGCFRLPEPKKRQAFMDYINDYSEKTAIEEPIIDSSHEMYMKFNKWLAKLKGITF